MAVQPYDPKRGLQSGQTPPVIPGGPSMTPTDHNTDTETDLRFSPDFSGLYRQLDQQQVQIENQKQNALGQLQSGYQQANQDLTRMQKLAKARLQAQMSDQGILRSGITVGAQGNQEEDYLRQLGDLSQQHTQTTQAVEGQTADALSQLNFQRENLLQEQARAEAEARLQEALTRARLEQAQPKPTQTGALVKEAFQQHGLDIATDQETEEQRVARIAHELDYGGRTTENLLDSLRGIQSRYMSENDIPGLKKMVSNLFTQYGVPLQASTTPESPEARLNRIAQELTQGRSLVNLQESLKRLAGK